MKNVIDIEANLPHINFYTDKQAIVMPLATMEDIAKGKMKFSEVFEEGELDDVAKIIVTEWLEAKK